MVEGEHLSRALRRFLEEDDINLGEVRSHDHLRFHLQVSTISYISLKTTSVATYGYLSHPCYLRLQSDQSYTPEVVSGRLHVESS